MNIEKSKNDMADPKMLDYKAILMIILMPNIKFGFCFHMLKNSCIFWLNSLRFRLMVYFELVYQVFLLLVMLQHFH